MFLFLLKTTDFHKKILNIIYYYEIFILKKHSKRINTAVQKCDIYRILQSSSLGYFKTVYTYYCLLA